MSDISRIDLLKKKLNEITGISYLKGDNLITLCPCCEKKRFHTNRSHGHLYLNIKIPIFRCFRCEFKGILPKALDSFNLNFSDYFDESMLQFDWKKSDLDRFKDDDPDTIINDSYKRPTYELTSTYENKLLYLKSRITNFSEDMFSYQDEVILNLKDFIISNNLQDQINKLNTGNIYSNFLDFIDDNFIGFICTRKSLLIGRSISDNTHLRYFKIKLKEIYFKDFYSRTLDGTSNKVILCEGIFDLLNVLKNPIMENVLKGASIISCALNNDFKNTLISTLDYVKIPYADVIVLSDKDIKEYRYMDLYFCNLTKSLTLYYNELGKDFGEKQIFPIKVPINRYIKKE